MSASEEDIAIVCPSRSEAIASFWICVQVADNAGIDIINLAMKNDDFLAHLSLKQGVPATSTIRLR